MKRNTRACPASRLRTACIATLPAIGLAVCCAPVGKGGMAAPAASGQQLAAVLEPEAAGCEPVPERGFSAPDALDEAAQKLLFSGDRVEVPGAFDYCDAHYVGGVGYVLVNASPRQVFNSLNQLTNLSEVIRGTRRMTVLGEQGGAVQVLMEQGNSVVSAPYTALFEQREGSDLNGKWEVNFWLDPTEPHAIEDMWGVIRAQPFDTTRTIVTVGTALNVGPGVIRMLFEGDLQRSILRMPRYVRRVVERFVGQTANGSAP